MTENPYTVRNYDHLPLRIGSSLPCGFRLARRNGELILQAGYQWQEGNAFGVEWKDIPIVDLDKEASND